MKIGVVAAGSRFDPAVADRLLAHVAARWPDGSIRVEFHAASFLQHHHFAGDDAARAAAVLEVANDAHVDAVWFTRGGYGACRIAETVLAGLGRSARDKRWLGFSDAGFLLAGLYRAGFPHLAHGPMASDILRGPATVDRALDWLSGQGADGLEPSLASETRPVVAFNLSVLSSLMGTGLEPDLTGHVLMLEDVSEPLYRIDRLMFHLSHQPGFRRLAGVRAGRFGDVIPNDPEFELGGEAIVAHWCARAGVDFLGAADIGHDADNTVVPFGHR